MKTTTRGKIHCRKMCTIGSKICGIIFFVTDSFVVGIIFEMLLSHKICCNILIFKSPVVLVVTFISLKKCRNVSFNNVVGAIFFCCDSIRYNFGCMYVYQSYKVSIFNRQTAFFFLLYFYLTFQPQFVNYSLTS